MEYILRQHGLKMLLGDFKLHVADDLLGRSGGGRAMQFRICHAELAGVVVVAGEVVLITKGSDTDMMSVDVHECIKRSDAGL